MPPQHLRIPGPTPLPDAVREAGSEQMVGHRGPEFMELVSRCSEGMRPYFQTKGEVMILTSSGTGGLEAAVVSFLSPGDPVLTVSIGNFGERFGADRHGLWRGRDDGRVRLGPGGRPRCRPRRHPRDGRGRSQPQGRAGHLQRDLHGRDQPAAGPRGGHPLGGCRTRSSWSMASAPSVPCPWRWTPGTSMSWSPAPRRPG